MLNLPEFIAQTFARLSPFAHSTGVPSEQEKLKAFESALNRWEQDAPLGENRAEAADKIREAYRLGSSELWLRDCSTLSSLPDILPESLTHLRLDNCPALARLPENLPSTLIQIHLRDCYSLQALPHNLPPKLEELYLFDCWHLSFNAQDPLPDRLKDLRLTHGTALTRLPDALPHTLQNLVLSGSRIQVLPALPDELKELRIYGCSDLHELPRALPPNLRIVGRGEIDPLSRHPLTQPIIEEIKKKAITLENACRENPSLALLDKVECPISYDRPKAAVFLKSDNGVCRLFDAEDLVRFFTYLIDGPINPVTKEAVTLDKVISLTDPRLLIEPDSVQWRAPDLQHDEGRQFV